MISILFVGDISFANISEFQYGEELVKLFKNSDLVVGNLESVLTERTKRRNFKTYYLKSTPDKISYLKYYDALSLANNHIIDYRKEGMEDTMMLLKRADIGYFGAGLKNREANEPFLVEIKGKKIAILGATRYYNSSFWQPAGTSKLYSISLLKRIRALKKAGYFIIIMPHWGFEHIPYPSPKDREYANRLVSAGGDVIIGSHPHEMQGMESIKGNTVFYSLGNFIFSSADFLIKDNHLLYESYMVILNLYDSGLYTTDIIPFITSDRKIELAASGKKEEILSYFNEISNKLKLPQKEYNELFYNSMFNRCSINKKTSSNQPTILLKLRNMLRILRKKILILTDFDLQSVKVALYIYKRKYINIINRKLQHKG